MAKPVPDRAFLLVTKLVRILTGVIFIGTAIYYKEWFVAIPGVLFVIQGILNKGCNGECYTVRRREE